MSIVGSLSYSDDTEEMFASSETDINSSVKADFGRVHFLQFVASNEDSKSLGIVETY